MISSDTLDVAAVYYTPEHFRKQSSYRPNLEEQGKVKSCSFYFQTVCVLIVIHTYTDLTWFGHTLKCPVIWLQQECQIAAKCKRAKLHSKCPLAFTQFWSKQPKKENTIVFQIDTSFHKKLHCH